MSVVLGGSNGITFPDNSTVQASSVSSLFTPYVTDNNNTLTLLNTSINGNSGIKVAGVNYTSYFFKYTININNLGLSAGAGVGGFSSTSPSEIWSFVDNSELYYNSGYSSIAPFNLHDYLYYYSSGFVSAVANNRPVQVTVNVNNSVVIGSRVWNTYAFDTQSSYSRTWPTNSSLTLNLASNSYIVGKGGEGSDYYRAGGGPRDNPAYNGGYGMRVTIPTTITNNGTIAKGGGGGYGVYWYDGNYSRQSTGGGGAGYYPGQGGGTDRFGASASAGTLTTGGSGSGGGRGYANYGKNLGVAGYTEIEYYGTTPAITGNNYITWATTGTILGPVNP